MREERLQDILSHSCSDWAQWNTTGEEDTFGFSGRDGGESGENSANEGEFTESVD